MIVDRSGGQALPLGRSGIPIESRITFFDQVHTTGMDIPQPIDAQATVLLGKDMTFRDYAQACWRMRGLGRGQSVRVLIVQELRSLIMEASQSGDLKVDIVHWLLLNSIKSEHLQQTQLCQQDVAYVWRRFAHKQLRKMSEIQERLKIFSTPDAAENIDITMLKPLFHEIERGTLGADYMDWEGREGVEGEKKEDKKKSGGIRSERIGKDKELPQEESEDELSLEITTSTSSPAPPTPRIEIDLEKNLFCLSLFKEAVDHRLPDHPPLHIGLCERVEQQLEQYRGVIPIDEGVSEILKELKMLESQAYIMGQTMCEYDSEIVQEQEQQQQQEQQQSTIEDIVYSSEKMQVSHWPLLSLFKAPDETSQEFRFNLRDFIPLSSVQICNMHRPAEKVHLPFPDDVLVSKNHTHTTHKSHLQRRLKSAYVAMAVVFPHKVVTVLLSLLEAEAVRMFLFREELNHLHLHHQHQLPHPYTTKNNRVHLFMTSIQPGRQLFDNFNNPSLRRSSLLPIDNGRRGDKAKENQLVLQEKEINTRMHLQCIRFFNCDFKFSQRDIDELVVGLKASRPLLRHKYFLISLVCHEKQQEAWGSTRVSQVFHSTDKAQEHHIQTVREKVKKELLGKFGSLKECFVSLAEEGVVSAKQMCPHLKSCLVEAGGVGVEDLEEMLLTLSFSYAEKGAIGLREFVRVFSEH